jgi:hypothetical protein
MNHVHPVVKLCIEGTQAEFQGLIEKACEASQEDCDCIAAH